MHYVFKQGNLDGLCSAYSIINSISYLKSFDLKKCKDLFREVYATASDISPSITLNGLYFSQMEMLLSDVKVPGIKITLPFRSVKMHTIGDYYAAVADRINHKPSCAIIGLGAPMHHWTVAEFVHPRSISLIDSGGMKQIRIANAGLKPEKGKVHIHPRQTIFFERV